MNYEWIGKTVQKKCDPTNRTEKIKVKLPHVNKKTTSKKEKLGSNKKLGLE